MANTPGNPLPGQPLPGAPSDAELEMQQPVDVPMEDFEGMMDDLSAYDPPTEGELIKGLIVNITDKEVIVDCGLKLEGAVPIDQVRLPDGSLTVKRGDEIDVMVDREGPMIEGYVRLSHRRAQALRYWDHLESAFNDQLTLSGRVLGRVKGGLQVDVGIPAFMPASQVDVRPIHDLDQFVGQDIPVRVAKLNRRRGNVVVSRRMAVEQEVTARKTDLLAHLQEGAAVPGTVKNLTDYGAFIDLGGIDGLLHVSDMSYGRLQHPSELLHVGEQITVKVLRFDRERERISLGMKQLYPDPWETAVERYPMGLRVIGRVVSVTDYGAFVELEPGVEGLIHISEMTWSRRMKHPSKVVKVGDEVESVVLDVKPKERRISLGIKQLEADPWTTVAERYAVGSVVEGRVRKLTDFGAFIEIEEGVDGLVHISDLSWSKKLKHPSELIKKGQILQAVVLQIDPDNRRLSLGVKQLQPDAWETFFRAHVIGDIVPGKVVRAAAFGVFVELADGVEGLCHNSEIPGSDKGRREGSGPALAIGTERDFKIIRISETEKKIGLSCKDIAEVQERRRMEEYHQAADNAAVGEG